MKYLTIAFVFVLFFCAKTNAQKVDSIYFHLYTDSLKKGTYNYINVDGLLSNGQYVPLDTTQVLFTSSDGKWVGNNLILEPSFSKEFVTVTAQLKKDRSLQKTVVIYMKKKPDDERLKTEAEILNEIKGGKKRRGH